MGMDDRSKPAISKGNHVKSFKLSLLAVAVALSAGLAHAEYKGTSLANSNGVVSSSGAYAASAGNGGSYSAAGNVQVANSQLNASASTLNLGVAQHGAASTSGQAQVGSASFAGNVSWGSGTGTAGAGGASVVNAGSSAYYDMHANRPKGDVEGSLSSVAQTGVSTGTNGFAVAGGLNTTSYSATSSATKLGWTDSSLFNKAQTGATATSTSLSGSWAVGTGVIGVVNVGGDAGAGANAKSGNAVSSN